MMLDLPADAASGVGFDAEKAQAEKEARPGPSLPLGVALLIPGGSGGVMFPALGRRIEYLGSTESKRLYCDRNLPGLSCGSGMRMTGSLLLLSSVRRPGSPPNISLLQHHLNNFYYLLRLMARRCIPMQKINWCMAQT